MDKTKIALIVAIVAILALALTGKFPDLRSEEQKKQDATAHITGGG